MEAEASRTKGETGIHLSIQDLSHLTIGTNSFATPLLIIMPYSVATLLLITMLNSFVILLTLLLTMELKRSDRGLRITEIGSMLLRPLLLIANGL